MDLLEEKEPSRDPWFRYEAYLPNMIADNMGGAAVNGSRKILDAQAGRIRARIALVIRSRQDVEAFLKGNEKQEAQSWDRVP